MAPLHLELANRFRSTCEFYLRRARRAIAGIENTTLTDGCRIWRLYNHGFVIRTASVTIGCDLKLGWRAAEDAPYCGLSAAWAARLADQLDLLTISHLHEDHFDPLLRDLLFARGVPIVVPPGVYEEIIGEPLLLRPERLDPATLSSSEKGRLHALRPLRCANGRRIQYVPYPGHQGAACVNNMHLLRTSEGLTILHTGDQAGNLDWAWIERIGDYYSVDVLLVNCWTTDMWRLVRGVRPRLVITGHETEMTHEPAHREAYWRSFELFRDQTEQPALVLCWGEGVGCWA